MQGLLSVKRIEDIDGAEDARAHALAQFVRLPLDADPRGAMVLAGLDSQLPNVDHCLRPQEGEPSRSGYESLAHLELLAAGDVNIRAGGNVSRLALNLFPLSGAASGVLYTTRDQSAVPLPPRELYSIETTGSEEIPQLTLEGRAPDVLSNLTVGGVPLADGLRVSRGEPLDLTWAEGEGADVVYVQLVGDQDTFVCSFRDDQGSGTVPGSITSALPADSDARLSIHRVRELTLSQYEPRFESLLRFDFELSAGLHVE